MGPQKVPVLLECVLENCACGVVGCDSKEWVFATLCLCSEWVGERRERRGLGWWEGGIGGCGGVG